MYGTGPLIGLSTTTAQTIVPKNTRIASYGVYKINEVPAALTNYIGSVTGTVTTASTIPYSTSITGPIVQFEVSPTVAADGSTDLPIIAGLTTSGSFSSTLNVSLTALANVGGTYKLKGQTTATTISPISAPITSSSEPTVYEDFLFSIAKSLGLATGYTPSH